MIRTTASVAAVVLALAGCSEGGSGGKPRLTVSAAQSLKAPFEDYGTQFDAATVRLSFAGSDELAAQIRQGVRPDVYAAADTALPEQLYAEGLVERPVRFAGNRLVIAVPAGSDIQTIDDLTDEGTQLAVGADTVPVGAYTRQVLDRLPAARRRAILSNVRSNEPDVSGVVGKLAQGAADAGFLYATDLVPVSDSLRAIELPRELAPEVAYGAAVVRGAERPETATAFIEGLLSGAGRRALEEAGFEAPPG